MSARDRIVAHAKKLAAISAASASLASACGNSGYAVVDPLPSPPRRCSDVRSRLIVTATFETGDAGALVIHVRVSPASGVADLSLDTVSAVTASAPARVVASNVTAQVVTADVAPGSDKFAVLKLSPLACAPGEGNGAVSISLKWSFVSANAAVDVAVSSDPVE